jgi:hypothetical protein
VRRAPLAAVSSGTYQQVQRMGNPLINELLVGTGFKDRFSMDQPKNDAQFANFFLDPLIARVVNALFNGAVAIPTPPRVDLLPVVTYAPPIAAQGLPRPSGRPAPASTPESPPLLPHRQAVSACLAEIRRASPTAVVYTTTSWTSCCARSSVACWPGRPSAPLASTHVWATV